MYLQSTNPTTPVDELMKPNSGHTFRRSAPNMTGSLYAGTNNYGDKTLLEPSIQDDATTKNNYGFNRTMNSDLPPVQHNQPPKTISIDDIFKMEQRQKELDEQRKNEWEEQRSKYEQELQAHKQEIEVSQKKIQAHQQELQNTLQQAQLNQQELQNTRNQYQHELQAQKQELYNTQQQLQTTQQQLIIRQNELQTQLQQIQLLQSQLNVVRNQPPSQQQPPFLASQQLLQLNQPSVVQNPHQHVPHEHHHPHPHPHPHQQQVPHEHQHPHPHQHQQPQPQPPAQQSVYSSNITEITDETIKFIQNGPTLIIFYAPWCSHCVTFKPTYEKIVIMLKERNLPIRCTALNGSTYPEAIKPYGIKGFPTIGMFRNGVFNTYEGDRSAESVMRWVETH